MMTPHHSPSCLLPAGAWWRNAMAWRQWRLSCRNHSNLRLVGTHWPLTTGHWYCHHRGHRAHVPTWWAVAVSSLISGQGSHDGAQTMAGCCWITNHNAQVAAPWEGPLVMLQPGGVTCAGWAAGQCSGNPDQGVTLSRCLVPPSLLLAHTLHYTSEKRSSMRCWHQF